MKAVYEKPFASISLFEANSAIAGCTSNMDIVFDCLRGPTTQTDNVMCASLNYSCNRNIGFADMNGATTKTNSDDNIAQSTVNFVGIIGSHTSNSNYITITSNSVSVKSEYESSFLGWLYFGANQDGSSIGTSSWNIVDGVLTYTVSSPGGGGGSNGGSSGASNFYHEHIAPVFNANIGTSL